jgi:hypothetical protein
VTGRVKFYPTFSISGLEKMKKAKKISSKGYLVSSSRFESGNFLDYRKAINVNKLERRGAQ